MAIHSGLMEAYLNYHEEEWMREYDGFMSKTGAIISDYTTWAKARAQQQIAEDGPNVRLDIYLEWNGILGFTDTIYCLALGYSDLKDWPKNYF